MFDSFQQIPEFNFSLPSFYPVVDFLESLGPVLVPDIRLQVIRDLHLVVQVRWTGTRRGRVLLVLLSRSEVPRSVYDRVLGIGRYLCADEQKTVVEFYHIVVVL